MEWVKFFADLLADESKHFLLAASLGSLGYASISIMFYAFLQVWDRLTHRKTSTAAVYSMIGLCLLVGVSLALLSHAALDGYSIWYVTPIGEPLHIITR